MSSVNRAIVLGNLGKDPEVRSFQNGGKVCNFSVATSERWKDRQSGEQKERTEWHNITIRNEKLIEIAERYLRKGGKVYLEGSIQTRKYQDQSGADRYTTEIVIGNFDSKLVLLGDKANSEGERRAEPQRQTAPARGNGRTVSNDLDDDVPF